MPISEGLKTSLNAIREMAITEGKAYHQYVPIIDDDTSIDAFGQPILTNTVVMNEFMSMLVNRIAYTLFEDKYFRNPLQVLEGDAIPLGQIGQEIYVNPAKGRKYNGDDFAGLLQKYEAQTYVQYQNVNMDIQYPVTVSRHALKKAFVSWDELERFITQIANSLYNGAYIDEFQFTKMLVSNAYRENIAQIEVIEAPNTEAKAKEFVTKARTLFLNYQLPSTEYNAWAKQENAYGEPVKTWTNPEDIVILVRNDIRAYLDVEVLASAFNMSKADLMGNILPVDNFDIYNDEGEKIFDGSNIVGIISDKSWFRIKRQDMYLDEFYNANNRTWQYYLNLTKMYGYSLFANGVILATAMPSIATTAIEYVEESASVAAGSKIRLHIKTTPFNSTDTITFTSGTVANATVTKIDDRTVEVTGVAEGSSVITASNGTVNDTLTVTVTASA